MTTLKFGDPNAKLKKMIKAKLGLRLKTFTLPAGHTCPGAKDCLSRADSITGKVKDGEETEFRCFMATAEARSPSLRRLVWHNLEPQRRTRTRSGFDLPKSARKVRHYARSRWRRLLFA